jgi:hypothetical protein
VVEELKSEQEEEKVPQQHIGSDSHETLYPKVSDIQTSIENNTYNSMNALCKESMKKFICMYKDEKAFNVEGKKLSCDEMESMLLHSIKEIINQFRDEEQQQRE